MFALAWLALETNWNNSENCEKFAYPFFLMIVYYTFSVLILWYLFQNEPELIYCTSVLEIIFKVTYLGQDCCLSYVLSNATKYCYCSVACIVKYHNILQSIWSNSSWKGNLAGTQARSRLDRAHESLITKIDIFKTHVMYHSMMCWAVICGLWMVWCKSRSSRYTVLEERVKSRAAE